jgi:lipid-binding SYLF domain-containing protein
MKTMKFAVAAAAATLMLCMSLSPAMAKDEPKMIGNAAGVVKTITAIPKKGIPPALFNKAYGIAIIPGAAKLDFMASGRHASGVLLVHDKEGKWSSPVVVTLSGGTLGWQMVGEPMDIILVFKSRKSIDGIMKGKFTMGGKVMVTPGPVGQSEKAASEAEINSYVYSRGEFAEVSLAGAAVQVDAAANEVFYRKQKISAEDIVAGRVDKPSPDVANLQKLLAEYAAKKHAKAGVPGNGPK